MQWKPTKHLERELNVPLIRQCNILDFHPTPQMVLAFAERQPVEQEYLNIPVDSEKWRTYFNYDFSVGEINPCWLIDLNTLLSKWREHLKVKNALLEQLFDWKDCTVAEDHDHLSKYNRTKNNLLRRSVRIRESLF